MRQRQFSPFSCQLLLLLGVLIHVSRVAGWEHVQEGEALERAIAGGDDVLVACKSFFGG